MSERKSRPIKSVSEKFWSKVCQTDNCWLWIGAKRGNYGAIQIRRARKDKRIVLSAHHISWWLHFGEIPKGLYVLHRCDVPLCVRPEHLFLGTLAENNADAARKGRTAKGERHGNSKLATDVVLAIRSRYANGIGVTAIVKEFGTSFSNTYRIIRREIWRHV